MNPLGIGVFPIDYDRFLLDSFSRCNAQRNYYYITVSKITMTYLFAKMKIQYMINRNLIHKLSLMLAAILLFGGCTKEDLGDCSLKILLRYANEMESDQLNETNLVELIDYVDLYVFDQQNKFMESLKVDASEIQADCLIDVPSCYKGKTLVVWAAEKDGYTLPTLRVGDDIETLTLKLNATNNTNAKPLANLLHGGSAVATFSDHGGNLQIVDFVRTDNLINLSLTGVNNEEIPNITSLYDIKLMASNGHYEHDHSIVANSPAIAYLPTNNVSKAHAEQNNVTLETLRLHETYINDVILTIVHKASGEPITFGGEAKLRLVEYLLKTKPEGITNQDFLDQNSVWNISFSTNPNENIVVSITINGWTMRFSSTDL